MMWSASIGASASMSRSIEAVSAEPLVVSMARVGSRRSDALGEYPCAAAIDWQSSKRPSNLQPSSSVPPRLSPMGRAQRVGAAGESRQKHPFFPHFGVRMMFGLARCSKAGPFHQPVDRVSLGRTGSRCVPQTTPYVSR